MRHETICRPRKGPDRPLQEGAKLIIFFWRPRCELVLLEAKRPVRDLMDRSILRADDHAVPYRAALPVNQRLARGEVAHADNPCRPSLVVKKHDVELAENHMIRLRLSTVT